MSKRYIKVLLTLSIFGAIGCAPGLGERVVISSLPPIESGKETDARSYNLVRVSVLKFEDARLKKDSIKVNDRSVELEGDIGTIVQTGLIEGMKNNGAKLCLFDCLSITGEVSDWSMDVHPNFPTTKVEAKAKIKLVVKSKDGKVAFTGMYGIKKY